MAETHLAGSRHQPVLRVRVLGSALFLRDTCLRSADVLPRPAGSAGGSVARGWGVVGAIPGSGEGKGPPTDVSLPRPGLFFPYFLPLSHNEKKGAWVRIKIVIIISNRQVLVSEETR